MTIDQELRAAADELLEVISQFPVPPAPERPQRSDEVTVFDLRQPDNSTVAVPPKRRAAVAAGLAAAILFVVGVVVVADVNDGDVLTEPAVSSGQTDPAPPPTLTEPDPSPETVDLLGYRWSRVPDDNAAFRGGSPGSVTVGGSGLVAVGAADAAAAVWTSVDGLSWTRVPHDEAIFGGVGEPQMFDVTVGGPGLVAVGTVLMDGWGDTDAAVWTSADGTRWSRVPHDEALFGGALMSSVVVGGPGLVAVGEAISGSDSDAAVWTSVDGISWSRVPDDEAVFGGPLNQGMIDVTVGGPGFVAVGRDGQGIWDNSGGQVAAVWTSIDAVTWSRVPRDGSAFGEAGTESDDWANQVMISVTAGGPGLVAVGWDASDNQDATVWAPDAAVWTSTDGITWSRIPHDEAVFGGQAGWTMVDVIAAGPGLVAVGEAVWTSADGITWSQVPDSEEVFGTGSTRWGLAVGGPGLVAVGDAGSGAAVWVAAFEEPTSFTRAPSRFDRCESSRGTNDDVVVSDSTSSSKTVGSSPRWCRVFGTGFDGYDEGGNSTDFDEAGFDQAGFDNAGMWSVTPGGPGLVAVGGQGHSYYGPEMFWGNSTPIDGVAAVVWTSPDGKTWSRVPHDEAIFGGQGEQQMWSVTAGGPGLVAVGYGGAIDYEEADAAVWTSVDGVTWSRVPHDEAIFGGEGLQQMLSVTAGGPGLVAVGYDGAIDSEEADAAVWTSVDGITWSRVPDNEAAFGEEPWQQMFSVTAGGPGLVAVGSTGLTGIHEDPYDDSGQTERDGAVWTSVDGITWSRAPQDNAIFGGIGAQQMLSVTAGGPGLVAVGYELTDPEEERMDAAVWTSVDGITWSRAPHDEAGLGGTGWVMMTSVTPGGPGLVAVGADGYDEAGWDSVVWTSVDGITWSRAPSNEAGSYDDGYDRMLSVTDSGSGLVAVGREWGGYDVAAVWMG